MDCKQKYQTLFEHLTSAFSYLETVKDDSGTIVDFRFIEINEAFESITGISKKELIGVSLSESAFRPEITKINWITLLKKVRKVFLLCQDLFNA